MGKLIFLIGFMGTGKSSVAVYLADLLGEAPVLEADDLIAEAEGRPLAQIFAESGEPYFRRLETEWLNGLSSDPVQVVSCGGGMPLSAVNRSIMKSKGQVIRLTAKPATILERTRGSDRPLLSKRQSVAAIEALMSEREAAYQSASDMSVDTEGRTPAEVAALIYSALQQSN